MQHFSENFRKFKNAAKSQFSVKNESPRFLEGYVCISSRGPPLPLDLELYSRAAQMYDQPNKDTFQSFVKYSLKDTKFGLTLSSE